MMVALSWRVDRKRLIISLALLLGGSVAQPGAALLIRDLTNQALADAPTVVIVLLAVAVAVCLVGQLLLAHLSHLWYFELGELDEIELNHIVSRSIHKDQPLDIIESATVADTLDLLRQDVTRIRGTLDSIFLLGAVVLQLAATCVLLTTVSPLLLLLLVAAAIPALLTDRAEQPVQRARAATAANSRSIKHLRDISTHAETVKEVRIGGAADSLRRLHHDAQRALASGMDIGYRQYTIIRVLGQLPFAFSLLGAIAYAAFLAQDGRANAGELVMVFALTMQIGGQVSRALQYLNAVSTASSGLERVRQLENSAPSSSRSHSTLKLESALQVGLRLDAVSYQYPGNSRPSLKNITLDIPAGTSVAVVGENGAGKSTLIKLVQGLYRPTLGRILIDGTPLDAVATDEWHGATSALFQDFVHFDFSARESIGIGDVDHISADAIDTAVGRSGAHAVLDRIGGLDTYLGRGYRNGQDLSGGQWQTIGLARSLMKERPLILTLDEPGHSLDPESELRMIEAYERAASDYARRSGTIAFYVTHRLSSVRTADIVLVLRDGRIDAMGTHDELMGQGGHYSALFNLQAAAYN